MKNVTVTDQVFRKPSPLSYYMYGTGFGTYVCTVLLTFHCNILCRELDWLVKRILLYIKSPAFNTRCFFFIPKRLYMSGQ